LFLILAFARPIIISDTSGGANSANSTAVIVLDTGIHMRYYDTQGIRYNRAVEKVRQVLELLDTDDQVFLILSHEARIIKSDSLRLNDINCSYLRPDWRRVFLESNEIFSRYKNFNQELYIITDHRQKNIIQNSNIFDKNNLNIVFLQIGNEDFQNVGIDTLVFTSDLFEPGQPVGLNVYIRNQGDEQASDLELHAYLNDRREAFYTNSIAPGETKIIPLSMQLKDSGYQKGYIEVSDDALLADNRYYYNLNIPEKINILFVDSTPSLYLESALKTINSNSNVNITFTDYSKWGRENFNKYDKIFIANFGPIEPLLRNRLSNYLDQGGIIILMPGYNSIPGEINQIFAGINSRVKVLNLIDSGDSDEYYTLNLSPKRNPIFKNLFRDPDKNMDLPHYKQYFQISPSVYSEVILKLSTDHPYLLSERRNKGYLYVFAGYISDEWSDIHFKGLFLPLLTKILSADSYGIDESTNQLNIGDRIRYQIIETTDTNDFMLETPEKTEVQIIPVINDTEYFLDLKFQDSPGNYILRSGGRESAVFSVNVPGSPNQTEFDGKSVQEQNYYNLATFLENEYFSDYISKSRSGYEFWRFLIIIVIIALLTELLIIKKIEN
jgi:hypothetical protein